MIEVEDEHGYGHYVDVESGVAIPEDVYHEIVGWIEELSFDEDDPMDFSRRKYFAEYDVCLEYFSDGDDLLSIIDSEDNGAMIDASNFAEIKND